jgi:aminopeptidase
MPRFNPYSCILTHSTDGSHRALMRLGYNFLIHIEAIWEGTLIVDFENTLQKYADLIVQVGLNLRAGQKLLVRAPIQAAALVRLVTASAYRAGACFVDVLYSDEEITLARYENAPRDSFTEFPAYRAKVLEEYAANGDAMVSIYAENPDLLKGQDPNLIGIATKTAATHGLPSSQLIARNNTNWLVVSIPIPSWAAKVFPGLSTEDQMAKLWNAIFEVTRLNQPDPVADWKEHVRQLGVRKEMLNRKHYAALHYHAPGTDLTIGLPDGHIWYGGAVKATNGISFIPNMPTEEVFTMPHKDRVDGVISASLPLSYSGTLIENFSLTFKDGKVVDYKAEKGGHALKNLLEMDEGSVRLGEVALVPHNSPIAQSKMMFFNTLFDENAASHLALGRAYQFTMQGGEKMSEEQFAAAGGNTSLTHVDFMVGSDKMDIDAVTASGAVEPLMRGGNWVTPV